MDQLLYAEEPLILKDSSGRRRKQAVNKADLIESLSGRLGDRKSATAALDAVLSEIQNAVTKGDKVSIAGFGVFEKRDRAARTARNPRTGEAVKVKKTSVPAFRPGQTFKELVAAGKPAKKAAPAKTAAPAKATVTKATATKATVTKAAAAKKTAAVAPAKKVAAAPAKTAAKKAAPAKTAPAKTAPAKKAAARTTRGK
jgi:DNA-binding protein HU-beta